jgi:hypothetical protein
MFVSSIRIPTVKDIIAELPSFLPDIAQEDSISQLVALYIRDIITNRKFASSAMVARIPQAVELRKTIERDWGLCDPFRNNSWDINQYDPLTHCRAIVYHCRGRFTTAHLRSDEKYPLMHIAPTAERVWKLVERHVHAQWRKGIIDLIPELIIALTYFCLLSRSEIADALSGEHQPDIPYVSKSPITFAHPPFPCIRNITHEWDKGAAAMLAISYVERFLMGTMTAPDEEIQVPYIRILE